MDYDILPFPPERKVIVEGGRYGTRRSIIHGLFEVDVTRARELLRTSASGSHGSVSFTAYVVACLAKAIEANPMVQAYRDWRGQLVVFHDVDAVTLIEAEAGVVAVPHIIRAANRKTVWEISDEVRAIRARPEQSEQTGGLVALGKRMPGFAVQLSYRALRKDPHRFKQVAGTVVLSAVGMFGKGGGWGITFLPLHTLGLLVGGITQRPGVHDGAITIREYLSLTLSIDHDVVDGAPAARFAASLREIIESAVLLEDGTDATVT